MDNKVRVQKVEWLSRDAEEALVYITDEIYNCVAFSQPCEHSPGDVIEQPLLAFDTHGIELADVDAVSIRRIGSTLGHEIYAKIIDVELGILKVGFIEFELDIPLPGGLNSDCVIRFVCQRIDVF